MKQSIERSLKIIKLLSGFFAVSLILGCSSFETVKVEAVPEVELHDLNSDITQEFGKTEVPHIGIAGKEVTEETTNVSKNADPTMDIENEFFIWATDNVKVMDNMLISFFSPGFYGFRSETVSSLPPTPDTNNDGRLPRIPDFDPNIATKYVTVGGNTYYIIGLNLYDSSGNWQSSITEDYGMDIYSYAEREDTLDWSSDVGKDYYEEINGIMHHFYWTEDEGLLNEWTDEDGMRHIQGFH